MSASSPIVIRRGPNPGCRFIIILAGRSVQAAARDTPETHVGGRNFPDGSADYLCGSRSRDEEGDVSRRQRITRRAVIAATVGVLLAASAPAWAHVTVHSDDPTRGATDVAVTFRTPNEEDKASTVKLEVFFPTATPLLGVLVQPHPGWTAVATNAKLAKPVKTDDGTITEAVSKVTWTADSTADGLHPGQSGDFVVTAGQLPDAPSLTFKALQTYSNGDVVRWIDIAAAGAPEPDHPAPVLDLAAAASPSPSPSAAATPTPAVTASTQPPVATASKSSSDGLGRGLAIAALAAAILALLAALRPRRR